MRAFDALGGAFRAVVDVWSHETGVEGRFLYQTTSDGGLLEQVLVPPGIDWGYVVALGETSVAMAPQEYRSLMVSPIVEPQAAVPAGFTVSRFPVAAALSRPAALVPEPTTTSSSSTTVTPAIAMPPTTTEVAAPPTTTDDGGGIPVVPIVVIGVLVVAGGTATIALLRRGATR